MLELGEPVRISLGVVGLTTLCRCDGLLRAAVRHRDRTIAGSAANCSVAPPLPARVTVAQHFVYSRFVDQLPPSLRAQQH